MKRRPRAKMRPLHLSWLLKLSLTYAALPRIDVREREYRDRTATNRAKEVCRHARAGGKGQDYIGNCTERGHCTDKNTREILVRLRRTAKECAASHHDETEALRAGWV